MRLKVLKADNGDAILLSWQYKGGVKNVLVDGGKSRSYKVRSIRKDLYKTLFKIKKQNQRIDLLILTHVDDDHVGGLLHAFKNGELLRELCDKVFFNSGLLINEFFSTTPDESHELAFERVREGAPSDHLTSIRQGVSFESVISEMGIWHREIIAAGQVHEFCGAKFTILSPTEDKLKPLLVKWKKEQPSSLTASTKTDYDASFENLLLDDEFKEDASIHNGSSIAFLFEIESHRLLLLGDAHDHVICEEIRKLKDEHDVPYSEQNPLRVDYVKLSHHGSKYNTSPEFLELVKCSNFIVSTDGSAHGLPNKRTLARVQNQFPEATLYFNYESPLKRMFKSEEKQNLESSGFSLKVIEDEFIL